MARQIGARVQRHGLLGEAAHQALGLQPVLDQVRDGDDQQAVLFGEDPRSGMRAMDPSSFMISQMTPAGVRPARRARSTGALRLPGAHQDAAALRLERKHVPRCHQVFGAAVGAGGEAGRVGRDRPALMPVVTPERASMLTVNAVPSGGRLPGRLHHGEPSRSICSSVNVRQMRPRPCLAMKLMASAVANSAAMQEIALVLAILGVHEDHHLAGADGGDGFVDALGEPGIEVEQGRRGVGRGGRRGHGRTWAGYRYPEVRSRAIHSSSLSARPAGLASTSRARST